MLDVKGKSVVVMGASRGIGAATAQEFASAGANVVLAARSVGCIQKHAASIQKAGGAASAISCDVAQYEDVKKVFAHCQSEFGGFDILINNAGQIAPIGLLATSDASAWGQAIDVNLKGVYYGMRIALPILQNQGAGTIITVSSGAAHNPLEGWSPYCSAKAGAAMLTKCAALETGSSVRIMGLSPGTVATDMQLAIKKSGINMVSKLEWSSHIPAQWPAKALLWMCTSDADEFIGQEIQLREPAIRSRVGLI